MTNAKIESAIEGLNIAKKCITPEGRKAIANVGMAFFVLAKLAEDDPRKGEIMALAVEALTLAYGLVGGIELALTRAAHVDGVREALEADGFDHTINTVGDRIMRTPLFAVSPPGVPF